MKNLIFTSILLLLSYNLFSQTITNAGFENWKSSGKEPPFNWEEPTGWKSTNSLTEFTSAGISKNTSKNSGSYSVKIRSVMISEGWYSVLCNGNPKLISNFSAPDIDIKTGGEPLNTSEKPKAFSGFYKFTAKTTGDSAYVVVLLKKYNAQNNEYEIHAEGKKALEPATGFTYFEVPLTYIPNAEPDSFVIAFYSSLPYSPAKPENFTDLGELYVDDISFKNSVGLKQENKNNITVNVYPNPATEVINISAADLNYPANLELTGLDGKRFFSGTIYGNTEIDVKHFPKGLYMLQLQSKNGEFYSKKILVK